MDAVLMVYIKLLLSTAVKKTALTLCGISDEITHDQLTRSLNADGVWHTLLESITRPFGLSRGYLVLDDTVLEKPYGKEFEQASYVYSSSKGKAVFGYHVVLLIWTDGCKRIILGFKIYRRGGKSKLHLAMELLSYARNRLRVKPDFVLFDSWYASSKLLNRLSDYGWKFVTRLKRNRSFNGKSLSSWRYRPRWTHCGQLSCGLKVLVVRNDDKFFATNALTISRSELLHHYGKRQHIEESNKQLKLYGLCDCQMRSIKAQTNHILLVVFALSLAEKHSRRLGLSVYKYRLGLISKKLDLPNLDLARLCRAA